MAQEAHGLFNGVQSLVQLLPPTPMQENIRLSCLKVSSGLVSEACTEFLLARCARSRPACSSCL